MRMKIVEAAFLVLFVHAAAGCYESSGRAIDAMERDQVPWEDLDAAADPDMVEPPDLVEAPPEDQVEAEEDPPLECVPSLTQVRMILGSGVDSGEGERPEVTTLANGSFYLLGRKIDGSGNHRLVTVRVLTNGSTGSVPVDLISTSVLPGYHPFFPMGEEMGVLIKDVGGIAEYRIMLISLRPGGVPSVPHVLDATTESSLDAAAADSGSNLFTVWTEVSPEGNHILGAFVEYDGTSGAPEVLSGEIPGNVGQPAVAWSGERYLLVYFFHEDTLVPGDSDEICMVEIDGSGIALDIECVGIADIANNSIVGRPALVWAGDRWAALWEEAQGGPAHEARLHLTTKVPGLPALDRIINDQWNPPIRAFYQHQAGEIDIAWTGSRLGVVITHYGGIEGKKIYFAEFTKEGEIIGEAFPVNPLESSSFNPSITHMVSAYERYYLLAWVEYSSGIHNIHTATYGCRVE